MFLWQNGNIINVEKNIVLTEENIVVLKTVSLNCPVVG